MKSKDASLQDAW
jgi:chromosome segregation ATPase